MKELCENLIKLLCCVCYLFGLCYILIFLITNVVLAEGTGLRVPDVTITNEVLFVDQAGNVSRPETLATTADMAAIKAATLTAEEKAAAASAAAAEGTNLIADVVAEIGRQELVVYRYGYTDGLSAADVLDPDAALYTTAFKPLNEVNGAGLSAFSISYALKNSTPFTGQPLVRWRGALDDGTDFEPIDAANVEPVEYIGSWTNRVGEIYNHHYQTRFYDEADTAGFYIITLIPDDSAGDGSTFDLPNGVKNGVTATVTWDGHELDIRGGVVVDVREAAE